MWVLDSSYSYRSSCVKRHTISPLSQQWLTNTINAESRPMESKVHVKSWFSGNRGNWPMLLKWLKSINRIGIGIIELSPPLLQLTRSDNFISGGEISVIACSSDEIDINVLESRLGKTFPLEILLLLIVIIVADNSKRWITSPTSPIKLVDLQSDLDIKTIITEYFQHLNCVYSLN